MMFIEPLRTVFDIKIHKEQDFVEINFKRNSEAKIFITLRLTYNYPISEPKIRFNVIDSSFDSLYASDIFVSFFDLLGTEWKPIYLVSDIVVKIFPLLEKSLVRKTSLFSYSCVIVFALNLAFLAYFFWSSEQHIFHKLISINIETNPLFDLLSNAGRVLFPQKTLKRKGINITRFSSLLFNADFLFNAFHFFAVMGLILFVLTEKKAVIKKTFWLAVLLFLLFNPVTIFFALSNHLTNIGLTCFAFSALLLQQLELDLATVLFFLGQNFYPLLLNSYGVEFITLLVIYGMKETPHNILHPFFSNSTRLFRFGLRIGIYIFCMRFLCKECSPRTLELFLEETTNAIKTNLLWLPLSALILAPTVVLVHLRQELKEKDNRKLFAQVLFLNIFKTKSTFLAAELGILLLLSDCLFRPRSPKKLALLLFTEMVVLKIADRAPGHLLFGGFVQTLNFALITMRNSLIYKAKKISPKLIDLPKGFRILSLVSKIGQNVNVLFLLSACSFFIAFYFRSHKICAIVILIVSSFESLNKILKIFTVKSKIN